MSYQISQDEKRRVGVNMESLKKLKISKVEQEYQDNWCRRCDKYKPGSSDIDMVIIPKHKGMFGYNAIKHILKKVEYYKRYGQVHKKGRMISLIDLVIFTDIKVVDKVRILRNQNLQKKILSR